MDRVTENPLIIPETQTERKIVQSAVFGEAIKHKAQGTGHPERDLEEHIYQILSFIDLQPWDNYRSDLRFLGLTHDLGKYRVQRSSRGNIIGKAHGPISEDIAREYGFTSDERILSLIPIHDKYFSFFRKEKEKGKFDEGTFRSTFENVDLDLLIRFNYADSNNREKTTVQGFEDRCVSLGLRNEKVYNLEPSVLQGLAA